MDVSKLILACQRQERLAQRELYDLYVKLMMAISLRYVSDIHTAKDIVQETMLRFFRSVHRLQFENKKALDAYIRKSVVNESIRWIQKNKSTVFLEDSNVKSLVQFNKGESDLLVNALLQDIRSLSDGYRIIFNLFAIEGYSHKAIAEKLDISESTSRSQLSRARTVLQQKILNRAKHVKGI